MGRFDHLATTPARGAVDVLKWKLGAREKGKLGAREKAVADGFVTPHCAYDRSWILACGSSRTIGASSGPSSTRSTFEARCRSR